MSSESGRLWLRRDADEDLLLTAILRDSVDVLAEPTPGSACIYFTDRLSESLELEHGIDGPMFNTIVRRLVDSGDLHSPGPILLALTRWPIRVPQVTWDRYRAALTTRAGRSNHR